MNMVLGEFSELLERQISVEVFIQLEVLEQKWYNTSGVCFYKRNQVVS